MLIAHFVRFEIFIPLLYVSKRDNITRALDTSILQEFITDITGRYHGITEAHPASPALYKGWWRKTDTSPAIIDHLTYLFGLIRLDQSEDAVPVFQEWKEFLEKSLEQDVILMLFYPVQTIGNFF
jgi:hypothetical protein